MASMPRPRPQPCELVALAIFDWPAETETDHVSPIQPGAGEGVMVLEQVSNDKHKRRHAVLVGAPCPDPTVWITGCGWKFGRSVWAVPVNLAHTKCDRCSRRVGPAFQ